MLQFSYSGHETFSLRISWLPKAVVALEMGKDPFTDPRVGMATLGLGKNMVRSLAYWIVATGLAEKTDSGLTLTPFAKAVLGRRPEGFDPFLENNQTLWLIHWNLCQGWTEGEIEKRPYAWHFFANKLTSDEITASEATDHFAGGPVATGKELSGVTLRQHFEIFTRTYVHGQQSGPRSTPEESLDSPLTTLGLIRENGDRRMPNGRRETVFRFSTTPKPSLSDETFRYCLHEWWDRHQEHEASLMIRQITHDEGSPGRCFRLPEAAIHSMLLELARKHPAELELTESRSQRGVRRHARPGDAELFESIYLA